MDQRNCHCSQNADTAGGGSAAVPAPAAAADPSAATATVESAEARTQRTLLRLSEPLRAALTTTLDSARVRQNATAVRVRKNIRKMTPMEINVLRNAYEGLYEITNPNDERGYTWIAGRHGYPGNYCHRNEANFWVWHRAYMYEFEERLRDAEQRKLGTATVSLPYWDWTVIDPATDDANGIPKVCSDATYTDLVTGETKTNPLFTAYSIATSRNTVRYTTAGLAGTVGQRQKQVNGALDARQYLTAQQSINFGPHGNVHVNTGGSTVVNGQTVQGDMSVIRNAAFDPIFWLHHSNIDRIWWEWQQRQGNSTVPQAQLDFVAAPWSWTGEQCLTPEETFGYTYRDSELFQAFTPAAAAALKATGGASPARLSFQLGSLKGGHKEAKVELHNVRKTVDSYEVRVFVNHEDATAATPTDESAGYAGSLWIFGHGECIGDAGHCEVPVRRPTDRRPPHHNAPYNTGIDVTDAVRRVASPSSGSDTPVSVSFVVLDAGGNPAPDHEFYFDGLSLETK